MTKICLRFFSCHITRLASIIARAHYNSLIPDRNSQASSPLIER